MVVGILRYARPRVVALFAAALACLSARFSLSDFPDFLVMDCRGDLSDIACPLIAGAWMVPMP